VVDTVSTTLNYVEEKIIENFGPEFNMDALDGDGDVFSRLVRDASNQRGLETIDQSERDQEARDEAQREQEAEEQAERAREEAQNEENQRGAAEDGGKSPAWIVPAQSERFVHQ
jgi:hypothetical protein